MQLNRLFSLLVIVVTIGYLAGCGGGSTKKTDSNQTKSAEFKRVRPSSAITSELEVGNYLADHFWDNYPFGDTTMLYGDDTEQGFAEFITVIRLGDTKNSTAGIRKLMKKAEADSTTFAYFAELADKYLYDPNSPMRNEEQFIVFMETMLESPIYDPTLKIRVTEQHTMAMKNRIGSVATDFKYTTIGGVRGSLYGVRADYTIIFFNNPDCPACKEIREYISASKVIGEAIGFGEVKILAIYTDEDLAAWRKYAPNIPTSWINGYDSGTVLLKTDKYDLKAIPTLYLLDKDKKVILKDAFIQQIEEFLSNQQ